MRARPSLGTNKAACIHETTHRRRLPLTDPRIHEWSVGYQWAARCYPHALSTGALSTPPHLHFRACSRSHAIARARLRRRVATTEKATMRMYARNYAAGPRYFFFFLVSSASFFSLTSESREGEKIARRVTTSPPVRASVRTYVRCYTAPQRKRERENPCRPGKDFLGDVRKSPRSRSRIQNKARHAMACCASCITSSLVARLICIIPAPDYFSSARHVSSHPPLDNCTRYLIFDSIVGLNLH